MDPRPVESDEWVLQCSLQLHEHWRRVDVKALEDIARELGRSWMWRSRPPRQAALDWLRLGIPTA